MANESLEEALLKQVKASNNKMVDYILKLGADVNKVKIGGKSLLVWAKEVGDAEIIEKLEQHGAIKERISNEQRDNLGRELYLKIANDGDIKEIEALIFAGANLEYIENREQGKNILMLASEKGRIDVVERILPYIKDINDWDMSGNTALMYACQNECWDVVEELIKLGADANIIGNSGQTVISYIKDEELLKKMIDIGMDVNIKDEHGNTALIVAIKNKDIEFAKYLIEKGADIKLCNDDGRSAICVAIENELNDFAFEMIEQSGGIESDIASNKKSFLHVAVIFGNIEFIKELLDKGININIKDAHGENALMYAIRGGAIEIAEFLIERGINVNDVNLENVDALQMALRQNENTQLVKKLLDSGCWHDDINYLKEAVMHSRVLTLGMILDLEKYKGKEAAQEGLSYCAECSVKDGVISELIKRGADINHVNKNGENILISILKEYHSSGTGNVDEIINCGIDLDFRDREGNTAVHYAARECHKWSLKELVSRGANIDAQNNKGQTPLMLSMTGVDYLQMFDLLGYGADINIRDNDGKKAIHYAQERGDHMVSMFVKKVSETTDVRIAKKVGKVKNKFMSLFGGRDEK
jgi:ankyrin repeat protein